MRRISGLLLVFLALLIPARLNADLKKDIRITLEEKQIQDLHNEGLTLVFYLNLNNSSRKPYYLSGYAYRFVVNEREFLRLQTPVSGGLRIDPETSTMISLPVKITYELLYRSVGDLSREKLIGCYLMGELAFSDGRRGKGTLPIAYNAEFPVYREPAITFNAIQAKAVTIGGADLMFDASLSNANSFDMTVTFLTYTLKFGGHEVSNNRRNGETPLPAGGKVPLAIPVLVNFFDVGKAVHGLLQQEAVNCRMLGEVELRTPWGTLTIPYDVEARVPVKNGG